MKPFDGAHTLYTACFAALPTERASFVGRLGLGDGTHLLERRLGGCLAAFAAVRGDGLLMLCVEPTSRGRGLGGSLLAEAEALIAAQGSDRAVLGRGGGRYLMQGVPTGGDRTFFERRGYCADWTSVDMILPLADFTLPTLPGYPYCNQCRLYCTQDIDATLLRAVAQVDPAWIPFFRQAGAVALAEVDGEIASFVILEYGGLPFAPCFASSVAGLGCLGTVPALRNRGIGLTLAAYATDILRQKGFDYSYLGYTWLEQWYARLGYHTFHSFWMGEKKLQ